MFLATAEIVRHLLALPELLLGLAIARWPEGLARFYANVFGDLGADRYRDAYASPSGVVFVRLVGILFALISAYWMIVGTG